jgi:hypothetical protein
MIIEIDFIIDALGGVGGLSWGIATIGKDFYSWI